MLNEYFDQIYVINLDSRPDRLKSAFAEFKKIGATFVKIQGVDGHKEGITVESYHPNDENFWNPGAAGLLLSTLKALKDAKKNGYLKILICEDDIEFSPDLPDYLQYLSNVPSDWQMMLLGAQNITNPEQITKQIARVRAAYCLHCYAVNHSIYDYYISLIQKGEKQLDLITMEDIQPLNKTYCFTPNMAYQKPSFSNIQNQNVNHSFLKSNKKIW